MAIKEHFTKMLITVGWFGTGALIVQGGATVESNLSANTAKILDDTAASSTDTAAFTVVGGVGIGKNLIIGAVGSSTGTTTITVPMNAPSTLYYQCTVHSVMGNIINIV